MLSPLKPSAWASFLSKYLKSNGLRIHLLIILYFEAKLGYKNSSNTFILSNNLNSALKNPTIIEIKQNDLASRRVIQLQGLSTFPYICSLLSLVLKHDSGWQRIHHLFYFCGELVNHHIPNGVEKLRCTRFQEVLQLVIEVGRHCIILKKDVKDAFGNIFFAFQHQ